MKLSFVIPAWNEEKYIGRCLEAIIKDVRKSVRDIEIIVVNNASDDRTGEIARSFSGVKVIDEPRKGLPMARQAGFLASGGDLIANVDADSILPPGWIEKAFRHFSSNKKLVALSGPYVYYDLSSLLNLAVKVYYLLALGLHWIGHNLLGKTAILQGGNFVLRRTALKKIGGFNTKIKFYGEDTDIANRIQKVGRVKFVLDFKMPTSGRRLKKEGIFKTAWKYVINYIWIIFFKKPFTKKYNYVGDVKME